MMTVFRCSFGDCSSAGGLPISEYVVQHYGGGAGLVYCLFQFCISVGLLNVVNAIFVDATVRAAADKSNLKACERMLDEARWSRNVVVVIKALLMTDQRGS